MSYWVPEKSFNIGKDVGAFFLYMLDVRAYEKHCQKKLDTDTIAHDLWSQGLVGAFVKDNCKEESKLIKSFIKETWSYKIISQKLDKEKMIYINNETFIMFYLTWKKNPVKLCMIGSVLLLLYAN